jgi:hypothetical protein
MKATLEFNLPEEDDEFRTAVDGHRWRLVVTDLDEALRTSLKYNEDEKHHSGLLEARNTLNRLLEEYGLDIV